MTLNPTDEIVATHDLRRKTATIQRGTHGVVLNHWGNDMLPIYRVRFSVPGFPSQSLVLDDLTAVDITQHGFVDARR